MTGSEESTGETAPEGSIDDNLLGAAYRLLIEHPGFDLVQFAEHLDCSTELVHTILDRLADLALLHPDLSGHSETVMVVSPLAAMHTLITQENNLLYQRQQFLRKSAHAFTAILAAYSTVPRDTGPDRIAEQLEDMPAVWRRLQELAMSAKKMMLAFSPGGTIPGGIRATGRIDLAALDRGVQMRTMFLEAIAMEPNRLAYAQELVDAGVDVRLVPELPMPMVIVDGGAAVVPRNARNEADGALVIHQEVMLAALLALFETYWDRGRPLRCALEGSGDFSIAERAVLRLLATGAKDDAVARQLGTSVRTVRRTVSTLMSRAGVSSRFAFGVYAAAQNMI